MEGLEVARKAVEAASEKQATNIVLLDVRPLSTFADFFVICTGESERQLRAIYEEIEHVLKKEGVVPYRHEGTTDSGWVVLDYSDVVIHIFAPFEREYYKLDELWPKAIPVVTIQ
ncbi:MAG: ribosome silencing factor [Chloroflexi bacterium]|nr:ribosome silencing factor [Chloroflexota bacterium]